MAAEVWKPVIKDGYYASSEGRIQGPRKIRVPRTFNSGYLFVNIVIDGKTKHLTVHRLVAEAFLGPCPIGMEINHIDGNKLNNKPDNLQYISRRRNNLHAYEIGRIRIPKYTGWNDRLSMNKIREIRELSSMSGQQKIAKIYGISQSMVSRIHLGKMWGGRLSAIAASST